MNDHLFTWLETRLEAGSAEESDSTQRPDAENDTDLMEELDRLDRCAAALGRIWPRKKSDETPEESAHAIWEGTQCGRFEIRELLGQGGMGNVFRGYDPAIGREVALKIPHPGLLLDPRSHARFAREAQAAGILRHPNIVPVLESGTSGPTCYIAFEYCNGSTLSQWLTEQGGKLSPETAVKIILSLAEATQHAHDRGVVHRDLKPGNILMDSPQARANPSGDPGGQSLAVVPKITDFGLAYLNTSDSNLTGTGATLGTAEYMSPEQSLGGRKKVSAASDQFSLGVILYQLLTGVNPFRRSSLAKTIAAIQEEDPVQPFRRNPDVSKDLAAVCLKTLSKAPGQRYETVGDFADDLQRVLDHKTTRARPTTSIEATGKWLRRHPTLAGSIAIVTACLLSICIIGWWSAGTVRNALNTAEGLLYAAEVRLAAQAIENANSSHAIELLSRHIPVDDRQFDRRTFAWHYLWGSLHKEEAIVPLGRQATPYALSYSPDGRRLLVGDSDGRLHMFDVQTRRCIETYSGNGVIVRQVQFSASGEQCIAFDDDGGIALWNLGDSSAPRRRWDANSSSCAQFCPQADELIVARDRGTIEIWPLDSSSEPRRLGEHSRVQCVACSPDGRWVISVGDHSSIKLWNRKTGELVAEEFQHSLFEDYHGRKMRLDVVTFSPDSSRFAVGSQTGHIFLWDVQGQTQMAHFGEHTSNIYSLHFSPDGRELASASKDTSIRIWDLDTKMSSGVIQGHGRPVYDVCYSPDGRRIASCGKDQTIRIWNRLTKSYTERRIETFRPGAGQLSPDSRRFAGGKWGGQTFDHQFEGATNFLPGKLNFGLPVLAYSPDGRYLAVAGERFIDSDTPYALPSTDEDDSFVTTDLDSDGDLDQVSAFGRWGHLIWRERDGAKLSRPQLFSSVTDVRDICSRQIVRWDDGADPHEVFCRSDIGHVEVSPNSPALKSRQATGHHVFETTGTPTCLWPADIDNDGDEDLIVTRLDDETLCWYECDPSLAFQQKHPIADVESAYAVAAADVSGDEQQDVILLTKDDSSLVVLERRTDGSFAPPDIIATDLPQPSIMDVRDVNGDGRTDIMLASRQGIFCFENSRGRSRWPTRRFDNFGGWARQLPDNVVIWDVKSRRVVSRFHGLSESIWNVAFSPDSTTLVTSDRERSIIRLWRVSDGRLLRQLPAVRDVDAVRHVAFTPDEKSLLFVAGDNFYVHDLDPAFKRLTLMGHDNTVTHVSVTRDGRFAATTSHDYSVRVWDLDRREVKFVLVGHRQRPQMSCFSPDERTLATVSHQGEVLLWDLKTGQQMLTLNDFRCVRLFDLRFQANNTLVVAGDVFEDNDWRGTAVGTWKVSMP